MIPRMQVRCVRTRRFVIAFCGAVAGMFLPSLAFAQNCVGFTDVDAASPFCSNVAWIKDRGVTLGCTGTTYCPTAPVIRLSMAAFMNRLGQALSPEVMAVEGNSGAIALPGVTPFARRCSTADSTVASYPRSVTVYAAITGLAGVDPVRWRAAVTWSTDGGATWQTAPAAAPMRASAVAGQWSGASPIATFAVSANSAYRFAIELRNDDVAPGGDLVESRCQITASIENSNAEIAAAAMPPLTAWIGDGY